MARKLRSPWIDRERGQPNWYIYWYDQTTGRVKRRSSGESIRSEAEKRLADFLIERANGQKHNDTVKKPDQYPIATALRWYQQEKAESLASPERMAYAIEHLLSFFKEKTNVSDLTPQKQIDYERFRAVKSATVRREMVVLRAAINHAIRNGRLTSAPKIILPKSGKRKDRYLNSEEIKWLIQGCITNHIKLFVLLALNTGARKGALLDLRWPQVDLVNGVIDLNPKDRTETNKRRAIVPINASIKAALLKAREDAKNYKEKKESEAQREGKDIKISITPYVISYMNQQIINLKKGFYASCRRAETMHAEWLANLEASDPARFILEKKRYEKEPFSLKDVTPHTLRHTAGTLLAQAGIDFFMIAKLLGHSVAKTTELYAHHRPDYLRPASEILSKATMNF